MAIIDILKAAQGGAAIAELGKAFGLDARQVDAVVSAVVPELTRKVERNTLSRGGLADLVEALGQGHHREYLRNPALYRNPAAIDDGNGILDHLVGGKDGSRAIADRAEAATGVDAAVIRQMLPVLAGMTMGGFSQEVQGAFGDILGRMGLPMPDERQAGGSNRMGIPDVSRLPGGESGAGLPMGDELPPGQLPRSGRSGGWSQPPTDPRPQGQGGVRTNSGGGLEMPDALPREGEQRSGRGGTTFPFPSGGGDNPYGDLADILRKGLGLPGGNDAPAPRRRPQERTDQGGNSPFPLPMPGGGGQGGGMQLPGGAIGGGLLWQIIRSVLGNAAGGFESKGVMGYIIKAVILRYGWSILRSILGRAIGR